MPTRTANQQASVAPTPAYRLKGSVQFVHKHVCAGQMHHGLHADLQWVAIGQQIRSDADLCVAKVSAVSPCSGFCQRYPM